MISRIVGSFCSLALAFSLVRASRRTIGGSANWHKEDMINCHYN